MSSSTHSKFNKFSMAVSIPTALLWFGVMFFSIKWLLASTSGRLVPGVNTSGKELLIIFLLALLLAIGGLFSCIMTWMRKLNSRWQTVSLIGAFVIFWAVCGH